MTNRDERTPAQVAEDEERRAHALCLMESDRVCDQTCEMPDGPATYACDLQHAAISRAIKAARWAAAHEVGVLPHDEQEAAVDEMRREYEEASR